MKPLNPNPELMVLAAALSDLRDSWMHVSMALKDHLSDAPSAERDEVLMQVERDLVRIKEGDL
jgi:hypothetical protein